MPRDGSNIYHRPPGTDGIPDTTIESTKYNINVADVEQDLNLPRPIIAGGTGANNTADARFNLAAETATQIVTNYDSQVWTPGSFQSAIGATSAPNSTSVFAGVCYLGEALANPPTNQNVVIEARDMSSPIKPGPVYTRQKTAGVWTAWGTSGGGGDDASNRAAIYAAPFDALAYNGMQINGSMEVSQEIAPGTASGDNKHICDSWFFQVNGTPMNSKLFAYNTGSGGIFYGSSLYVLVNTAVPSLTGPDIAGINHNIEGYRIRRLLWGTTAAQPITIGFWTAHNRTGTYTGTVRNAATDRSYAFSYSQNAANVSEYKVITIPGCQDGSWNVTNLVGIQLAFSMGCGSTYMAPSLGNWVTGNYVAGPGQVNAVAATSDVFRITGVVILPGTEAPSAARSPLIMRPFGLELETCRRYFFKSYPYSTAPGTTVPNGFNTMFLTGGTAAANYLAGHVVFPVSLRTNPTITLYDNHGGVAAVSYLNTGGTWVHGLGGVFINNSNNAAVAFTNPSNGVATLMNFDFVADARL